MPLTKRCNFGLFIAFIQILPNSPQYSEMIKIRLQRHGARHAPFYRIVVAPSQARRDGKFIEVLGTYHPQAHKREEELKLKIERIDHWLGVGAQPTDTAKSLIRQGRMSPEDWLLRAEKLSESKLKRKSKGDSAPSMEDKSTEAAPSADEPKAEKKPEEEAKKEEPAAEEIKEKAPKVEESEEAPATEEPKAEEKPVEEAKKEEKPNLKKAPSKAKKSDEKANESESEDSVEEEKKDS